MPRRAATKLRICVLTAIAILTFDSSMRAQVATADLVGTITDSSGSAVPGAVVTARNTGTGLAYNAVAGAAGDFFVSQLPAGRYDVQVSRPGFKTWKKTDILLAIGDRYRAQVALELGAMSSRLR